MMDNEIVPLFDPNWDEETEPYIMRLILSRRKWTDLFIQYAMGAYTRGEFDGQCLTSTGWKTVRDQMHDSSDYPWTIVHLKNLWNKLSEQYKSLLLAMGPTLDWRWDPRSRKVITSDAWWSRCL